MLQLKALLSLAIVAVSFVDARPSSFDAALAQKRSPLHEHRDIHLDAPKRRHRRRALCSSRPFNVSDGPSNGNNSSSEGGEVLPDIDIQPAPEQPEEQAPPPQEPAPAPEPEPEPQPAPEPAPEPAPAPPPQTGIGELAQEFLDAHNGPRAKRGAAPLTWNNELAAAAQRWANRCEFEHSGGQLGQFGENLAAGSNMSASGGVKAWVDEEPEYNPSNPKASHFTQVVWKGSRELGCAVARCARGTVFDSFEASYYVCEYFPAGNVIGRFPENV